MRLVIILKHSENIKKISETFNAAKKQSKHSHVNVNIIGSYKENIVNVKTCVLLPMILNQRFSIDKSKIQKVSVYTIPIKQKPTIFNQSKISHAKLYILLKLRRNFTDTTSLSILMDYNFIGKCWRKYNLPLILINTNARATQSDDNAKSYIFGFIYFDNHSIICSVIFKVLRLSEIIPRQTSIFILKNIWKL